MDRSVVTSPFTLTEDNGRLSSGLTCADCSCQRAEISQHVITKAMNNQLATHFRTYFQLPAADASALAGAFGLMNLFARSLGGISSDVLFKYVGFRGRIWAQFLALFFEAVFLFCFGLVDNSQPWYVALAVLVCFSLFVQMAEGTSCSSDLLSFSVGRRCSVAFACICIASCLMFCLCLSNTLRRMKRFCVLATLITLFG